MGASIVNFVPTASPAASAAIATVPQRPADRAFATWTSSATLARSSASETTSVSALPGSSRTISGVARTIAAPTSVSGATPAGAPMHHAARSASANQPRLSSGDSQSVPKSRTPTACSSSDDAGKKAVSDVLSTKCSCEVQPVCTNRSDVGMWYQRVSAVSIPWCSESKTRVHQAPATPATAITAA